jgi:hypothetical protein
MASRGAMSGTIRTPWHCGGQLCSVTAAVRLTAVETVGSARPRGGPAAAAPPRPRRRLSLARSRLRRLIMIMMSLMSRRCRGDRLFKLFGNQLETEPSARTRAGR